jgi:two-component system, response regulator YesN
MKKMQLKRMNSLYTRFVFSYLLVLTVAMSMGIIVYFIAFNIVKNDIIKSNKSMLNQSKSIMDQKLSLINMVAMQIATNKRIIDVSNETVHDAINLDIANVVTELGNYKLNLDQDFIYDYFVYLKRSDYIVTPETAYQSTFYYNYVAKSMSMSFRDWQDILGRTHKGDYSGTISISYNNKLKKCVLYMMSIPFSFNRKFTGTMVVLIDKAGIDNLFSDIGVAEGGYLYIQDKTGNTITTIGKKISGLKQIKIGQSGKTEDFLSKKINGKNMMINYTVSAENGWKYVLVLPEKVVMGELIEFERMILIIFFAALLLGVGITMYLSNYNSKPFSNILNYLKDGIGDKGNERMEDAFKTIKSTISELINNNNSLQDRISKQKPMLVSAFIDRLLKGEFSNINEICVSTSYVGIDIEARQYLVLLLRVFESNDVNEFNEEIVQELNAVKILLLDVLGQNFSKVFSIDVDLQTMSVILCFDGDEDYRSAVSGIIKEIFDKFCDQYNSKILFGLGNTYKDPMEIWRSYQEAMETLNYVQMHSNSKISWFDDIPRDTQGYYYPLDYEQQIINHIKTGDSVNLIKILVIIKEENFKNRNLTTTMCHGLYYEIKGTLTKLIAQIPQARELLERIEKFEYRKAPENDFQQLFAVLEELCKTVVNRKSDRNLRIINQIVDFIKANYMNKDLGLTVVASEFKLSEGYLSYFFKEQTGRHFTDYVEQIRMDEACNLLMNTQLNINEIFDKVGYNSAQSFRRAFKRIKGVSPNTMRGSCSAGCN